jgi:hypothetical protein
LRPDGIVEAVHPPAWAPPWAEDAQGRAEDGTYIARRRGHLVLIRDAETFWRSRLAHGSDEVVVHGNAIAFTGYVNNRPDVWAARAGGAEHLAGHGENLDGWARAGGFFTQRANELRLRAPGTGRLLRHLAFVRSTAYDRATHTMVAITTSELLVRTDGKRTTILADLVKVGFASFPSVQLLDNGLLAVQSDNRLLFLGPDGTRFASAALARGSRGRPGASISSTFLPLPGERGVVFVVNRRETRSGDGTDRVLLLERGHHVPRILYERGGTPLQCVYWVGLSLVGDRLLYALSGTRTLVVVSLAGKPPLDLSAVVRSIPGFRAQHAAIDRAAWATRWND